MRLLILLSTTTLLAACGGAGEQTISAPPPVGGNGTVNTKHTFAKPTEPKSYKGIGANHVYEYLTDSRECCDQQAQIYAGTSTTARASSITIAYDPREAVYTLTVQDSQSGAQTNTRFQDPASRTDFGGAVEPQWGTPNLDNPNIQYLQAGDGDPRSPFSKSGTGIVTPGDNDTPADGSVGSSYQATSLFVLKPGTETQYVTYAGYARNAISFGQIASPTTGELNDTNTWHIERGAFAFGEVTPNEAVPKTGTGSYSGSMLASMIFNPTIDGQDASGLIDLPSYFQWIDGTANINVNFATSSFQLALDGTVHAPQIDRYSDPQTSLIQEGAKFLAAGRGDINMINFGGFKGIFDSASLANAGGSSRAVAIEGSAIDGTFYGPGAQEVGGGFRIVGGNPDERVDILGTFVGKK